MKTITEVCQEIKKKFTYKDKSVAATASPVETSAFDRLVDKVTKIECGTGVKPSQIYISEEDYIEILCDTRTNGITQPMTVAGVKILEEPQIQRKYKEIAKELKAEVLDKYDVEDVLKLYNPTIDQMKEVGKIGAFYIPTEND